MRNRVLGATALVLAGVACAPAAIGWAQPAEAPVRPDPARVAAGTYVTDPAHTLVGWRLNHLGFNDYFGIFGDIEGTLVLDPGDIAASKVDISVPISHVTVASEGLKDHLLRPGKDGGKPDFFGPEPGMARFVSDGVTRLGATRALITGTLSMNGQSHPVALNARLTGVGESPMGGAPTIGFEATTVIERSQWGLDTAVPMVGDEVDLTISAAFEKQ